MTVSSGTLVTGEAVALELRTATVPSRGIATLIDFAVQFLLWLGVSFLIGASSVDPALADAVSITAMVLVWIGYPVVLETVWGGRTLGKAALGQRVVRDDGGPIRFRHALLRGLTGVFLEKPGITLCAAALISMFSSLRSKRVGDLLAGTVVLQQRVPAQVSEAPPMPPPLAGWATTLDLSRLPDDLALSVRRFLSRAHQLNPAAREQVGSRLAAAVAAVVTPPAPPGTPGWAYLSAVLAERRRREELRLAESRAAPSYADSVRTPPPSYPPPSYTPPAYPPPAPAPQPRPEDPPPASTTGFTPPA